MHAFNWKWKILDKLVFLSDCNFFFLVFAVPYLVSTAVIFFFFYVDFLTHLIKL